MHDHDHGQSPDAEPGLAQFWEERYAGAGQVWSGRANKALVEVIAEAEPPVGRALDLGCGEGGDVVWLARHGWRVTGVDISPTAIARGAAAATAAGIPAEQVTWVAADLGAWTERETHDSLATYDLVTASFLHSPVEIPRTDILRRAAALVAPHGHLLIVSHAEFPPWSTHHHDEHLWLSPAQEVAALDLPTPEWEVRLAETRPRAATGPDGQQATLDDGVVLLRRR